MTSVSVVVPSYNHAAYVEQAIRSALDQSHVDLEVVVTDDGSRDGTPDVIRRIDDPRLHLEVFAQNRGAAAALNSAIRRSRGEFICFLPSDDVFLPGRLERQVRFLRENPHVAAVFGMPRFVDQRGAPLANSNGDVLRAPFTRNLRTRSDWLRHFFYEGNCLCHPASMVRRSAYDAVGLFDPRLANLPDLDMWVRICKAHEIRVLPDEVTAKRILDHDRNMSAPRRDSTLRALIERFHVLKRYRGLPRGAIHEIFAREIESGGLDADAPVGALLAELALLGRNLSLKLFALDTMFEAIPEAGDHPRLIELAGAIDLFAIDLRGAAAAARAEVADLRAAAAEQQRAVEHLHAALAASRDEALRLRDQRDAANDQRDAARAALREIAAHAEAIATGSRVWRLVRVFKGLRYRIEMIGAAARAPRP